MSYTALRETARLCVCFTASTVATMTASELWFLGGVTGGEKNGRTEQNRAEQKGLIMSKAYIKLYYDVLEMVEELSDGEFGRLVKAALIYARTGEAPKLNGTERILFPAFRLQIDRDSDNYDRISKERAAAGRKGGTGKHDKANETTDSNAKQSQANGSKAKQNAQDKDKDKDEYEDIYVSATHTAREDVPYPEIMDMFNSTCTDLPMITTINSTRKTLTACRYRECGVAGMRKVFEIVQQSDFLTGRGDNGGSWKATYDWIIKAANWQKITEGNYANRQTYSGMPSQDGSVAPNGRYAPTFDINEVEKMFNEEWDEC